MEQSIEIRKAATNNLKSLDLSIPLHQLTVVTGVSGSGKSSLVFDTLYGEAYRRYLDSLSSFARQYLQTAIKPQVGSISNLPPAVAVKQNRMSTNHRSTVGTLTELNDFVQTFFNNLSTIQCQQCKGPVQAYNGEKIAAEILRTGSQPSPERTYLVTAPLQRWDAVASAELQKQLSEQGFHRLLIGNQITTLADIHPGDLSTSAVVVDRVKANAANSLRFAESCDLALRVGKGLAVLVDGTDFSTSAYSTGLECIPCGITYPAAGDQAFSFNHPLGACRTCHGFGRSHEIKWEAVLPDLTASLATDGIAPLNFGDHHEVYKSFFTSAKRHGIPLTKAFEDYTHGELQWLRDGDGEFHGIVGYFAWLDSKRYKAHYRIHAARFRRYVTCVACQGSRFRPDLMVYRVLEHSIADALALSIEHFQTWLENIQRATTSTGASSFLLVEDAVTEALARVAYLRRIGLGYLSLDRVSGSLSGGELQRIHVARCLGSALTDTLYCLDEPTSGLHARDSSNLLQLLHHLRDQGNTVVVVEHDRLIIDGANHIVDIGPGAGHSGGSIVYAGSAQDFPRFRERAPTRAAAPIDGADFLELKSVSTHNLRDVSVRFPLGHMTVVCGVSGSGKTSLIQHTLYPLLARALKQQPDESLALRTKDSLTGTIDPRKVCEHLHRVYHISQKPLSGSRRSNIATYLGIFDHVRKIFASQDLAVQRKLKPGAFSFNVAGGRCETCKGLGFLDQDLSFLGNVAVGCPTCNGLRFSPEVLDVTYRSLNLYDLLQLTLAQARELFFDSEPIVTILDEAIKLGLGYLTLGQHTSSFSGGESQRLKLLSVLTESSARRNKPSLFIFDEPTAGLADRDVHNLLAHLRLISAQGHTLVIVEHHLEVIRHGDWVIELGPEAAERGGELIYQGIPDGLKDAVRSATAPYL